jgi:fused signal recognition particle receptor
VGFFDKLKQGLTKTRKALIENTEALFRGGRVVDEGLLGELEENLIMADVGPQAASSITGSLRDAIRNGMAFNSQDLRAALKQEMRKGLRTGQKIMCAGEKPCWFNSRRQRR